MLSKMTPRLVLAGMLLLAALLACSLTPTTGSVNAQSIEQTAKAAVTQAGNKDVVLTAQALATEIATKGAYNVTPPAGLASALPPGFGTAPEDIPIIPGSKDTQILPGVVQYTTTYSLEDAKNFYLAEMPKVGWTYNANTSAIFAASVVLRFTKSTRSAQIQIGNPSGVMRVQITYTR